MQSIQTFSLMYGGLTKPFIKKNVNLINQKKFKTLEIKTLEFLKLFEH